MKYTCRAKLTSRDGGPKHRWVGHLTVRRAPQGHKHVKHLVSNMACSQCLEPGKPRAKLYANRYALSCDSISCVCSQPTSSSFCSLGAVLLSLLLCSVPLRGLKCKLVSHLTLLLSPGLGLMISISYAWDIIYMGYHIWDIIYMGYPKLSFQDHCYQSALAHLSYKHCSSFFPGALAFCSLN